MKSLLYIDFERKTKDMPIIYRVVVDL